MARYNTITPRRAYLTKKNLERVVTERGFREAIRLYPEHKKLIATITPR
jgi:hypothetical protein